MPTPLRVQLNEEEDEALQQLSLSDGSVPIVKQRALALRLNAEGWNVPAIAQHLHLHEQTVCQVLKRWQSAGLIPILHDSATDRGSPAVAAPLGKGLFPTRILLPPFFQGGLGGSFQYGHL